MGRSRNWHDLRSPISKIRNIQIVDTYYGFQTPVRPRFLAITSPDLARSLSNFRTHHFSPSADFCQYGLLSKNRYLGYLSLPRNVNLIYYPDGGCTRRPTGLDGSAGQPRWVQPSLTPPTGRDPLGSRLSVVGRERDEDGGAAEADASLTNLCLD